MTVANDSLGSLVDDGQLGRTYSRWEFLPIIYKRQEIESKSNDLKHTLSTIRRTSVDGISELSILVSIDGSVIAGATKKSR